MEKQLPKVGLGVMIFNDQNQVLLILRNQDKDLADSDMRLEGTWTLPAGKMKYGETIRQSAIRKVKEEVNLDIYNIKVICVNDDINSYAHYVTIGLVALDYSGHIDLGKTKEHVDYGFFDLKNLPKNLCDPSKKIINNYKIKNIYKEEKE